MNCFSKSFGPFICSAWLVVGCGREASLTNTQSNDEFPFAVPFAEVIGSAAIRGNNNVAMGIPSMTSDAPEVVISRSQYVLSWNKNRRVLNWASWRLSRADLGDTGRTSEFAADPDLVRYLRRSRSGWAVDEWEYRGSCLDRGHQVPSGDRTDNYSDNASTFLMSNMLPQTPYFNRIVWERLEAHARSMIQDSEASALYQISGPIYEENLDPIGPHHDIAVASSNFKIIAQIVRNSAPGDRGERPRIRVLASVIIPNVDANGRFPTRPASGDCESAMQPDDGTEGSQGTRNDWHPYQVSVSEIERRAGINLNFLH